MIVVVVASSSAAPAMLNGWDVVIGKRERENGERKRSKLKTTTTTITDDEYASKLEQQSIADHKTRAKRKRFRSFY